MPQLAELRGCVKISHTEVELGEARGSESHARSSCEEMVAGYIWVGELRK